MKKKLMVLAMALGLSVAALTGCSKPTLESLVDGMYDNEIDSQTAEVDMDMVLSFSAQGMTMDISLGADMEVQCAGLTGDEQTYYMDGKLNMDMAGESESAGFEMYALMEDDTITSYVYNEDADTWYKAESEADDSGSVDQDMVDELTENMKNVLKENGELAEDTEDFEGEECYVITATIGGDDFVDILEPVGDMLNDTMEDAGVDIDILSWFEYFSMDVTYYISKDTKYLVGSEIDMADTDVLGMVNQFISDLGLDGSVMDIFEDISFSTCKFTCVMSDINDTEVEIPKDVINDAVSMDEAGMIDDIIGDVTGGGSDYIDPDYDDPDYDDPDYDDPDYDDPDPVTTDEWYDGDSFIFNKSDESDEFLCEVNIPDGYVYDEAFSDPEEGLVSLDREDGEGYIWVQNFVGSPMYYALLNNGVLDDEYSEYYEDYQMMMEVVGTAFGGKDVILAVETYTSAYDGTEIGNIYLCIQYDDGGYKEFLAVDLNSIYNLDQWTEDDFADLAVELFGR